jgi:arylsulfatase A-like enzyme
VLFTVADLGKEDWSTLIAHPKTAPAFNQLMKQGGISLDSFHAEPTCSPSRVAIMTGRRRMMIDDGSSGGAAGESSSSSVSRASSSSLSFGGEGTNQEEEQVYVCN